MMTIDVDEVAQLWASWASAGHHLSRALAAQDSLFDSSLKTARAATYERAVALLRANPDPARAAQLMIKHAVEVHVALRYTVARTWQRCALMIDPSLDEVQPLWTDR